MKCLQFFQFDQCQSMLLVVLDLGSCVLLLPKPVLTAVVAAHAFHQEIEHIGTHDGLDLLIDGPL